MAVDVPDLAEIIVSFFDEFGESVVIGAVIIFNTVQNFGAAELAVVYGQAWVDQAANKAYSSVRAVGRVDWEIAFPFFAKEFDVDVIMCAVNVDVAAREVRE